MWRIRPPFLRPTTNSGPTERDRTQSRSAQLKLQLKPERLVFFIQTLNFEVLVIQTWSVQPRSKKSFYHQKRFSGALQAVRAPVSSI